MATGQPSIVIRHLRRVVLFQDGDGLTDGQLLERFLSRREEAAFELLMRRHGAMVLGVCRRVLHNTHDAEDAFQATFFVLVRKATALLPRKTIGNWLYGVAYHTALKARAARLKRRAKESQVREVRRQDDPAQDCGSEVQRLLEQALDRLPAKYREPVVLCELEGRSRKEVARQLGIPEGTVSSRLATARRMLAKRLRRHGLVLSGGLLAAALSQNTASAEVPASLLGSTVKAATQVAAGHVAATGVISAPVASLTEGVLKAMLIAKLRLVAVILVAGGVVALGGRLLNQYTQAVDPPATRKEESSKPTAKREVQTDRGDQKLEETLTGLLKQLFDAHSRQDAEPFKKLLSDDFVGVNPFRTYTKEDALKYVSEVQATDHAMSDAKLIRLDKNAALLTYRLRCKAGGEEKALRLISAWVRRDGKWLIAFGQETPCMDE